MNEMTNPFFMATCQRSGGFFLMSLLNSTKKVGYVHEYLYYLNEGWEGDKPTDKDILSAFEQFREGVSEIPSPSGYWGTKVDIRELWAVERWLDLNQTEPRSVKWIWLRRRNKIRQAISIIKAQETEIWHLDKDDPKDKQNLARAEIEVDLQDLCLKTVRFYTADLLWSNYFKSHGIKPHILYYEDFIDELTWESTVEGIFSYLEVPYESPLEVSTHRLKQGKGEVPESYKRIIEDMQHYNLPLDYLDVDVESCYELDLETF